MGYKIKDKAMNKYATMSKRCPRFPQMVIGSTLILVPSLKKIDPLLMNKLNGKRRMCANYTNLKDIKIPRVCQR